MNSLNTPLLFANPNSTAPFRLGRTDVVTCDQNHDYMPEHVYATAKRRPARFRESPD